MALNKLKLIKFSVVFFCFIFSVACTDSSSVIKTRIKTDEQNNVTCDENGCRGTYIGPEFTKGDDVAHQFSNKLSKKVGDELKELYSNGHFSKVDLSKILMTTKGMGTGEVTYQLSIPFMRVDEKCEAYTSFDHVGGWNHSPALNERKTQLQKALLKGEALDISELKTTPEGLQEYWIQWKNKDIQMDCVNGKF